MQGISLSEYLDKDTTLRKREQLEDAFDLLKLDKHFDKEEFIFELLEQEYVAQYTRALEAAYEEFKEMGWRR